MARGKHVPIRTCVGCGEKKPKGELLRIVKGVDGSVFVDPSGKRSGRGAYICFNLDCLESALKKKALQKSLEVEQIDRFIIEEAKRLISERRHGLAGDSGVCKEGK